MNDDELNEMKTQLRREELGKIDMLRASLFTVQETLSQAELKLLFDSSRFAGKINEGEREDLISMLLVAKSVDAKVVYCGKEMSLSDALLASIEARPSRSAGEPISPGGEKK